MLEQYLSTAVNKAKAFDVSGFNLELFHLGGFSGKLTRILLNKLLSYQHINYLEIGVWQGSTFCSALHNNYPNYAVAIDNWSQTWEDEFNVNPLKEFKNNTDKFVSCPFEFYNSDCFKFDLNNLKQQFNIYFYDGGHSEKEQYDALRYYYNVLQDKFIYLVDDWNFNEVPAGTYRAINDLGLRVVSEYTMRTDAVNGHGDFNTYWNGYGCFVLEKA